MFKPKPKVSIVYTEKLANTIIITIIHPLGFGLIVVFLLGLM